MLVPASGNNDHHIPLTPVLSRGRGRIFRSRSANLRRFEARQPPNSSSLSLSRNDSVRFLPICDLPAVQARNPTAMQLESITKRCARITHGICLPKPREGHSRTSHLISKCLVPTEGEGEFSTVRRRIFHILKITSCPKTPPSPLPLGARET